MTRLALSILACALLASPAFAQQNTSELRGRVLDQQQAGVPGVTLTITNQASGQYRSSVSNEDGSYFVAGLAPGLYAVDAELVGFRKYAQRDVRLDLGHTTTLDVELQV